MKIALDSMDLLLVESGMMPLVKLRMNSYVKKFSHKLKKILEDSLHRFDPITFKGQNICKYLFRDDHLGIDDY